MSVSPSARRGAAWQAWGLLLLFGAVHLALAAAYPLAPDETYYWEWSRRPAWGYYDQGPLVAWWIRVSCLLLGDNPLGVRSGIVVAALLSSGFLFLLARDLWGCRAGLLAILFSSVTPLAMAGGFIATYDPLMVLLWSACLWLGWRAIGRGRDPRPTPEAPWLALGAAFGMGLLAKHTMALLAPCLLMALAGRPDWRPLLRRRAPWLALALALAAYAPSLAWQADHDWMTFRHLLVLTGKGADTGAARRLGEFVGSQVLLLTPIVFGGMVAALAWCWRGRGRPELWYLFCASAPVLLFFTLLALKSKIQANWAVAGWMGATVALAGWLAEQDRRRLAWSAGVSAGILTLLVLWPQARLATGIRLPARLDQMNKLYGGPELGRAADRERAAMERETGEPVVPGAATYDNASRMAFYMAGQPKAVCLFIGTRPNSYLLWNHEAGLRPGGNALLADDYAPGAPRRPRFEALFARVAPVARAIPVHRRPLYDEPVRIYYLYRCYGYRPNPRVETPRGG